MKTWSQWVQEHRDYLSAETFPEGVLDVDMAQAMLAPYMQGKHDKVVLQNAMPEQLVWIGRVLDALPESTYREQLAVRWYVSHRKLAPEIVSAWVADKGAIQKKTMQVLSKQPVMEVLLDVAEYFPDISLKDTCEAMFLKPVKGKRVSPDVWSSKIKLTRMQLDGSLALAMLLRTMEGPLQAYGEALLRSTFASAVYQGPPGYEGSSKNFYPETIDWWIRKQAPMDVQAMVDTLLTRFPSLPRQVLTFLDKLDRDEPGWARPFGVALAKGACTDYARNEDLTALVSAFHRLSVRKSYHPYVQDWTPWVQALSLNAEAIFNSTWALHETCEALEMLHVLAPEQVGALRDNIASTLGSKDKPWLAMGLLNSVRLPHASKLMSMMRHATSAEKAYVLDGFWEKLDENPAHRHRLIQAVSGMGSARWATLFALPEAKTFAARMAVFYLHVMPRHEAGRVGILPDLMPEPLPLLQRAFPEYHKEWILLARKLAEQDRPPREVLYEMLPALLYGEAPWASMLSLTQVLDTSLHEVLSTQKPQVVLNAQSFVSLNLNATDLFSEVPLSM